MIPINKISEAWKNAGIRCKLPAFIILIVLSSSAVFSALFISARKNAMIRAADEKVFVAANSARAILGDRYHDRIVDRNSVPPREFRLIVKSFDALCRNAGLQYIWSLMILNEKIVFTSATHSDLTDETSACAAFLEPHTNPDAYRSAFAAMKTEYTTFRDKWGAGRMVLIPGNDGRQRKYLLAASVRLDELDAVVRRAVLQSIAVSLLITLAAGMISFMIARSIAAPIARLTDAAGRIEAGSMDTDLSGKGFHEIRTLASALESMREAINAQMESLHRENLERMKAENALRTSEEKFSKAFDLSRAPMAISTMDGRYVAVNREFTAVMGWTEREAVGRTSHDLGLWVNPDDRLTAISRLRPEGIQRDLPVTMRTRNGDLRDFLFSFEKIEINSQPCLLSLAFDITERKRMEEELHRNEAVLRSMFEATPAGVGFLKDRVFLKVNSALCRITGYSEEELIGSTTRMIYPDDGEFERVGRDLYGQMEREGLGILESKHMKKDGTIYDVLLYLSPFERGNLQSGVTVTMLDITARKHAEAQREAALSALTASEERFRRLVESVTDYIYTVTVENGRAVSTSHGPGCIMVTGYTPEEYETDPYLWYAMLHEEDRKAVTEWTDKLLGGGEIPPMEHRIHHKDGSIRWVRNTQVPRFDGTGRMTAYDGLIADITERKAAEEELTNAVKQLADIIDFLPDATFIMDRDRKIIAWNRAMEEMTGVLKGDIIGKDHTYSTIPFYGTRRQYLMDLVFMENAELAANYNGIRRKGDVLLAEAFTPALYNNRGAYVFAAASPLKDSGGAVIGAIESIRDITEWKQAEQKLQSSLREKEALLRELYHRTKNNMQVICSMLSLQSSHMKEEKVTGAFKDMANRIHSMALVHEKLYQSKSLSSINLKEYISDLSRLLLKSYQAVNGRISILYDMEDVYMVIDSAVPCGLVLNELLSNSLKYAFPDGRNGEIRISLHRAEDTAIELRVADNGIGSPGFDIKTGGKMGIQTVLALGRQQLRGTVEFETGKGFSCTLTFRDAIYDARV